MIAHAHRPVEEQNLTLAGYRVNFHLHRLRFLQINLQCQFSIERIGITVDGELRRPVCIAYFTSNAFSTSLKLPACK